MFKNIHCCIGLTNSANLLIFKFRNFKFDLKYFGIPFRQQLKNSNACRFLNSYALILSEARRLTKLFRGSNFIQKCGPIRVYGTLLMT